VTVAKQIDDGAADVPETVIAVNLDEPNLHGRGHEWGNIGVVVDVNFVQVDSSDFFVTFHRSQETAARVSVDWPVVPPVKGESEPSLVVCEGKPKLHSGRTVNLPEDEGHTKIVAQDLPFVVMNAGGSADERG
jgi:hypothetical protein